MYKGNEVHQVPSSELEIPLNMAECAPVTSATRVRKKKLTSPFWRMFEVPSGDSPAGTSCKCIVPGCTDSEVKRTNGNTTTMMKHLTGQHPWEYQYCIKEGKPLVEAVELAKRHYQEEANERNGLAPKACNEIVFREKMVRFVVCDNVPFLLLGLPTFRDLLQAMRPDVRNDCCLSPIS